MQTVKVGLVGWTVIGYGSAGACSVTLQDILRYAICRTLGSVPVWYEWGRVSIPYLPSQAIMLVKVGLTLQLSPASGEPI